MKVKGQFVSTSDDGETITLDDGSEHNHPLAVGASVTLNGKKAKLADLQIGDDVELTGNPATTIEATR